MQEPTIGESRYACQTVGVSPLKDVISRRTNNTDV